ncbi:MBOAT family protein [Alphaproteobacteria bacterium]|nr:MBOAT family protein [Alphaproteobacteria bacterium]
MIFNSLTYLLLLFAIVPIYWALSYRARLLLIFISSLTFYSFWRIEFVPVLLLSVVVDYFIALRMPISSASKKKTLLLISLFVNLGLLFYFKYLIFFSENGIGLLNLLGAKIDPLTLNIILPLGISFYTFQTISYTVDTYRNKISPEKDFILYACYVIFFPQLVAGPVLRAAEVIHQFVQRPPFLWSDIVIGIRRITYGLFLKVVLADNIAPLVNTGFSMPVEIMGALDVWTLAFLFGFQIYFDFSAYSHIAIGSARLMGIKFPENFNFPYLSTSPKDFWQRWHISLSSWIRDYLYSPLVGVRAQDQSVGGLSDTSDHRRTIALFFTWAIMGLWHGANWTFMLWGVYHATLIIIYRFVAPTLKSFNYKVRLVGGLCLTLPTIMLGWIPFRAESIDVSLKMWVKVFNPYLYGSLGMRENIYLTTAAMLIGVYATFLIKNKFISTVDTKNYLLFWGELVFFIIIFSLVIIFFRPINQFIYFQF